jgi:hypothetical protein
MICNYQNINDYCLNQYSYQFIGTISNNGVVSIDKSETAPVLRTDKTTGENKVISQFSSNIIKPCSSTDDNESTTEWECYIIYRYIGSGYISDPPLDTLKNAQIDIINNSYDSSLDEGVLVNINNTNVILGSIMEDQIYYQSILNYSQALYDDDSDAVMPSFSDSQNKVYSVSYDTLVSIFKTYFNKVVYYKNLKESLVSQCLSCNTLSDIETLNWCNTKVLIGNIQPTKIVTNVEKTSVQNCEDITVSGPLCDPPCDPNSCESCVNGICTSFCAEGQCCRNGVCGECESCTINSDCSDCGCCVDDVCVDNIDAGTYCGDGNIAPTCPVNYDYAGDVPGTNGNCVYCCSPGYAARGVFGPCIGKCCPEVN